MNFWRILLRRLGRHPGFTAVAVLTLALGIGTNTAVFTVTHTLLLKPLPWPESERVVNLWESNASKGAAQAPMAAAQFLDLQQESRSFSALAAWSPAAVNLAAREAPPERYPGALVTEDFFRVVATPPALGRGFASDQFVAGKDAVVLIGHAVWQGRFGGDPGIIGRTLQINGRSRTVVGILPAGFDWPAKAQFWVPKVFSAQETEDRDFKAQRVLARLADGVSLESARAETATRFAALVREHPDVLTGWSVRVNPVLEDLAGPLRPAFNLLLAAVALVLLMACINVASLLLARGAASSGELSLRLALGASRGAVIREMLTESGVLAVLGGLGGVWLAQVLVGVLVAVAPAGLPRMDQVRVDEWALGFTVALCALTTLIAGGLPAWHLSHADPMDALRAGGNRATEGASRWRRGLVIFQIAAAVVVLVGAGLLLRSLDRVLRRDLGFQPERLVTARLELPPIRYASDGQRNQFADEVLRRLTAAPGLEAAAFATALPLQGWPQYIFRLEENPGIKVSDAPTTGYTGVSPSYFATLGMRVLGGRGFSDADREGAPAVCMVNEAFARRHFGSRNPLGQRLEVGFSEPPQWMEIVGVVNDTTNEALEGDVREQVFVPLRQQPEFLTANPALSLVVRQNGTGIEGIREAVWAVDRDQPVHLLQPMTQTLAQASAQRRFTVTVLAVFAGLALLLAAVGLYGVMSGSVVARTRELGIRVALGASRGQLLGLILGQGARALALGLLGGWLGAWALSGWLRGLLYQTAPVDGWTYLAVAVVLSGVGLIACWIPARRASRVDPLVALRNE